ncbi:unnamed protein product [Ambrosiozyma monospora]|uniref:Unnamed protein product n=1 Tax=Ambrosiozyma monospora TaxID=43982 RepID=A0ACB5U3L4_AMBMO|nr:unnamed protein product [Ambrosiozyma monospora]
MLVENHDISGAWEHLLDAEKDKAATPRLQYVKRFIHYFIDNNKLYFAIALTNYLTENGTKYKLYGQLWWIMLKRMFEMPELPQIVHWQTITKKIYCYAVESDMQKMVRVANFRPEVSSANVDRLNSTGQKFDKYFDLRSGLDIKDEKDSAVVVDGIFNSLTWSKEKGPEWVLSRNTNEFRKAAKSLIFTSNQI